MTSESSPPAGSPDSPIPEKPCEPASAPPDKPLKYFNITLGLFLIFPLFFLLSIIAVVPFLFLFICSLAMFISGISDWIDARKENVQPLYQSGAIPKMILAPLVWICVVLILVAVGQSSRTWHLSQRDLYGLSHSLYIYAGEHQDRWPDADQWCDQLIQQDEDNKRYLETEPDSGVSGYALNSHAQPLGTNMPGDMVLVFPSKPGWNLAGGAELLPDCSPNEWITVLLGDGKTKHVKMKDAPYLRWKVEGNPVKPVWDKDPWYIGVIAVFGLLVLEVIFLNRRFIPVSWDQALFLIVLAAPAGAFLGSSALQLYPLQDTDTHLGWAAGGASAFLAAIGYTFQLAGLASRLRDRRLIIPYAVILGAGAGVLCSSVTHAILMIHYEEPSPLPLLGGAGFGIYAGCLLGLLAGSMIKARFREQIHIA